MRVGRWLISPHLKNAIVGNIQGKPPRISDPRYLRRHCKTKVLIGSWIARTLFRKGSVVTLIQELILYKLYIVGTKETRREGKYIMDRG